MKISLITINLDNRAGLERTIASVTPQIEALRNGEHEIEHIIVDGMSSDGSIDIITPQPWRKIIQAPPKGVYNAINRGISVATGHIIGLLHSGDIFTVPDILNSVADIFRDNPDVVYVQGDVMIGHRKYSSPDLNTHQLVRGFAPPHPGLYISSDWLKNVGLYDESYRIAADFDYYVRLALQPDIKGVFLNTVIVEMQPGGLSQKWSNRLWHNNSERLRSLRSHGLKSNRFRMMGHYTNVLKQYLCSSKKK